MKLTKDHYIEGKIYEAGTQYEIVEARQELPKDGDKIRITRDFKIYDIGYDAMASLRAGDPYEVVDSGGNNIAFQDYAGQVNVYKKDLIKHLDSIYTYPLDESTQRTKEADSKAQDKEDSAQYKKFMKDFKDGKMKDVHGNVVTSEKQAHMIAKAKSEADDKKESVIKEASNVPKEMIPPKDYMEIERAMKVLGYDMRTAEFWEGINGFIMNILTPMGARFDTNDLKVLLKITNFRWIEPSGESMSIGF